MGEPTTHYQRGMKGYLSAENGSSGRVPVETRTEIYRDPEDGQEIVVETDDRTIPVGVADVTVSRKKNGTVPVVVEPEPECIEVRNEGNANGIHVKTDGDQQEIQEGFSARVRRDAVVQIGYQTEFRLTVEREAREEYVIDGNVDADGDVVMGDQRHVDERTTVEDVVAKELEVNGDGATEVEDAVANDATVGVEEDDTPTQNVCDEHGTYMGPVCPECASTDVTDESETKYCIHCGESIPAPARACPECGNEFPAGE